MYDSRLKKSATFSYKSMKYMGPNITNDKLNGKHLPYELCDSTKATQPTPASTKSVISC